MHSYERGRTDLCINEAIINNRQFIDVTRYYTQITPYISKFGRKNILIIDFEDLINKAELVMKNVSEFISIDVNKIAKIDLHSNRSIGGKKRHHKFDSPSIMMKLVRKFMPSLWIKISNNSKRAFSNKPSLSKESKEMIINMLVLEIIELQKLMGKDLGKWMLIEKY